MEPQSPGGAGPSRGATTHTPDGAYKFELGPLGALGSGAHGVVRLARHVESGEMVAIKVMPTAVMGAVAKELVAMAKVDHPNIVRLLGTQVDLDRKRVYMVMELCQGGELFDRIAECGKLEEDQARQYLVQMALAIEHCHGLNVYHRDLKPENILLSQQDRVKIADFGLAAMVGQVREDASFLRHTKCGSLMYAAPEVLVSDASRGYDAAKADIWSLGVILYSMLSGALPFQVANARKCTRYAVVEERGMAVLCDASGFSADASSILVAMLEPNPARRLSAKGVLAAAWVAAARPEKPTRAVPPAEPPQTRKWSVELGDKTMDKADKVGKATGAEAGADLAGEEGGTPKRRRSGSEAEAAAKRQAAGDEATSPRAGKAGGSPNQGSSPRPAPALLGANDAPEEVPPGVNGMLVRSLGWVQLPEEKEKMVGDVASALDSMGVKYEVVKGELTDVVWVGGEEPTPEVAAASHISRSSSNEPPAAEAADAAHAGSSNGGAAGNGSGGDVPAGRGRGESGPADGEGGGKGGGGAPAGAALELEPASPSKYSEGRLCVRIRVNPSAEDKSEVHIDRQAGDVLQFHSFYRDVRNQLAGANGWVENHGRYEHEVFPSQADFK